MSLGKNGQPSHQSKGRGTLRNGRSAKGAAKFENKFSRVTMAMQETKAFISLSATAIRILLRAISKNSDPKNVCHKDEQGHPIFPFNHTEALNLCGLSDPVFTRGKNELEEKGFLKWHTRGGLRGANGVASLFTLCSEYKNWEPPLKPKRDMAKARAAKKAMRQT
ncbi:MAG: hypothetical protein JJE09_06665 [Bacteroidia bacterium]|nr:hypothetical protein [Bacteroidia bacterium]